MSFQVHSTPQVKKTDVRTIDQASSAADLKAVKNLAAFTEEILETSSLSREIRGDKPSVSREIYRETSSLSQEIRGDTSSLSREIRKEMSSMSREIREGMSSFLRTRGPTASREAN